MLSALTQATALLLSCEDVSSVIWRLLLWLFSRRHAEEPAPLDFSLNPNKGFLSRAIWIASSVFPKKKFLCPFTAVGHYAWSWGNNGPFRLHVCCKDTICVVAYYRTTERTKTIKTAQDKNRFLSIPNMWNVAIIWGVRWSQCQWKYRRRSFAWMDLL